MSDPKAPNSEEPSTASSEPGARQRKSIAPCACCGRTVPLTFHHLIPRKLHRRAHFKKHFTKATLNLGIMVCRRCHAGIHKCHDEMTLGKSLNSLEELKNDTQLKAHFEWVARQRERI